MVLGALFAFAIEEGLATDNPVRGIRLPRDDGPARRPRRLTPGEVEAIGGGGVQHATNRKTLAEVIEKALGPGGMKNLTTTPSLIVSQDYLTPPGPTEGPGVSPVFDSFPQRRGAGGSARYLTQTGTVTAQVVNPAAIKTVGTWDIANVDADYEVVATLSPPISNSVISDGGQELSRFFNEIMGGAVGRAVDTYAVATIDAASTQTQAYSTSVLETVRKGITKLQSIGFTATHLYLGPADAEGLALITSNPYVFGSPAEWVDTFVISPAVTAGKGFVADAPRAALAVVREDSVVALNPFTDFDSNQTTIRVEARVLLAVTAPQAIVELDLTA